MSANAIGAPYTTLTKSLLAASTAAAARAVLDAASEGQNFDISDLAGLQEGMAVSDNPDPEFGSGVYGNITNGEATTIVAGTPCYLGTDNRAYRSDASNALKYKSAFIAAENVASTVTGRFLMLGSINSAAWSFLSGDYIYIANGGGLTNSKTGLTRLQPVAQAINPNLIYWFGGIEDSDAILTSLNVSGQPKFTGNTLIQKQVTANTGSAYTVNGANGTLFDLTLDQSSTITFSESIVATECQFFSVKLTNDGGFNVIWSGATWVAGSAPSMPQVAGDSIYINCMAMNGAIYASVNLQPYDSLILSSVTFPEDGGIVGQTTSNIISPGYVGQIESKSVQIASAVSLTTATAKTILSVDITPGRWKGWGNIGFIAASGTLPTIFEGSISYTTNSQSISPNGGAYFKYNLPFAASSSNVFPVGEMEIITDVPITLYLVGTATFTVSTLTAYGFMAFMRFV